MRKRSFFVWAAIVAASLIAVIASLTTWVNRQMLDEDSWRKASAELIQDPEVRQAVSVYLVNEVYEKVDVAADLEQRLPPDLAALAAPAAGALRGPATDAVERLLAAPRVQALWVNASSLAQEKLVNVLEDKTGAGITTGDGTVTLDLGELVTQVGTQLGVSSATLSKIPPDAGQITILQSDQLDAAQTAVKSVRVLSVLLFLLVAGLYALAVYLARGERRQTLRNVGWALVLVGLVALVARRLTGSYAIEQLTTPESESAGKRTWLIGSSMLAQLGWAAILYGVIIVAGTVFAGPTRHATAARRRLAPLMAHHPGIAWAVVGGAYLLLVLWGPTHALRTWWGILILAALLAAGIAVLQPRDRARVPRRGRRRHRPAARPGDGHPAGLRHERRSRPPRAAEIDVDQPWHGQRRCRSPRSDEFDVPAGGGCYRRRATRRLVRRATLRDPNMLVTSPRRSRGCAARAPPPPRPGRSRPGRAG